MFRVISALGVKVSGRAVHATPRRYKHLLSAIKAAVRRPGVHEIQADDRTICAVIKNGKVLGGIE